jgi:hypothetical protein
VRVLQEVDTRVIADNSIAVAHTSHFDTARWALETAIERSKDPKIAVQRANKKNVRLDTAARILDHALVLLAKVDGVKNIRPIPDHEHLVVGKIPPPKERSSGGNTKSKESALRKDLDRCESKVDELRESMRLLLQAQGLLPTAAGASPRKDPTFREGEERGGEEEDNDEYFVKKGRPCLPPSASVKTLYSTSYPPLFPLSYADPNTLFQSRTAPEQDCIWAHPGTKHRPLDVEGVNRQLRQLGYCLQSPARNHLCCCEHRNGSSHSVFELHATKQQDPDKVQTVRSQESLPTIHTANACSRGRECLVMPYLKDLWEDSSSSLVTSFCTNATEEVVKSLGGLLTDQVGTLLGELLLLAKADSFESA